MSIKKEYRENRYSKIWGQKLKAIDLLGGKCKLCSETHPATLSFHHINSGDKKSSVMIMIRRHGNDWPTIVKEIEKCELLCENCHRKIHFDQKRFIQNSDLINLNRKTKNNKLIKNRRWSNEDIELLKLLYHKQYSIHDICCHLNRTQSSILKKIKKLSLTRPKVKRKSSIKITKKIINDILRLSKDLSIAEIAKITNVNSQLVTRIIKENYGK